VSDIERDVSGRDMVMMDRSGDERNRDVIFDVAQRRR
jgi:hypothetical protein